MLIFYQLVPISFRREGMKHVPLQSPTLPPLVQVFRPSADCKAHLANLDLDSLLNSTLKRLNTIVHPDHHIVAFLPVERPSVRPDSP